MTTILIWGFGIWCLVCLVDKLNGHVPYDLSNRAWVENEELYRKECEESGEQWVRPHMRAAGRPNAGWGKEFVK